MAIKVSNVTVIDNDKGLQNIGGVENAINTLTGVSGTVTLDLSLYSVFYIDPAGACTISISNPPGSSKSRIVIIHMVGGGDVTVTWPGNWKWSTGVAPTLGTGTSVDVIAAHMVDATNWRAARVQTHAS